MKLPKENKEIDFHITKSHIHIHIHALCLSSEVDVDEHFLTFPKQLSIGLVCGKYLTGHLGSCCSSLYKQAIT